MSGSHLALCGDLRALLGDHTASPPGGRGPGGEEECEERGAQDYNSGQSGFSSVVNIIFVVSQRSVTVQCSVSRLVVSKGSVISR